MFFSRVYGFDIGELDVGVVECDEVNRVQMVSLVDVERFVIEWRWRWSMVFPAAGTLTWILCGA